MAPRVRYWLLRKFARPIARLADLLHLMPVLAHLESIIALIQGKGSASGWDIASEGRTAARFVPPGGVLFDVGSNRGQFLQAFLDAGGHAAVHAFEPADHLASAVRASFPEVTVSAVALGAAEGSAVLAGPAASSGLLSLLDRMDTPVVHRDQAGFSTEVRITTLESYCTERSIDHIDYLKIDTEGSEMDVLQGAGGMLEPRTIRAVQFEFSSAEMCARVFFHDFWELFTERGYRLNRLAPGGRLIPIAHYYEDLEYFRGATNYLALPPGIEDQSSGDEPWSSVFGRAKRDRDTHG